MKLYIYNVVHCVTHIIEKHFLSLQLSLNNPSRRFQQWFKNGSVRQLFFATSHGKGPHDSAGGYVKWCFTKLFASRDGDHFRFAQQLVDYGNIHLAAPSASRPHHVSHKKTAPDLQQRFFYNISVKDLSRERRNKDYLSEKGKVNVKFGGEGFLEWHTCTIVKSRGIKTLSGKWY